MKDNLIIKRYAGGAAIGFLMGVVVVHPFSMVFQGLVHPWSGVELGELFKAFDVHHLPMAVFFGILGLVVGTATTFFLNIITRERRRVKLLEGLLPICSYCKRIRDDTGTERGQGPWYEIEHYIASRTEADFTHGICRECFETVVKKELEEMENE